ncbi:MAG TPA: oligosaccharide flippase family protein [Terriglobia bacterium]|nr:oligosaccharide flippase family protein [Terriglobia bacterium]
MIDIRAKLRAWSIDRGLARNMASLYGVQFANYLLPLVTIPYLTRVLGPLTWGLVAFAQAFGAYASIGIEYGFHLSATRAVAKNRASIGELANLVAGVMGVKLVLATAAGVIALSLGTWIPLFRAHPAFLRAAMFWAVAQSFSMLWYYQGLERMRLVAVLDVAGKAAATAGIFIIVHHPADGWKVLALQGGGSLLSVVVAAAMVYREVPLKLPDWRMVRDTLRMGWSMFLFRSSMGLYGAGNAFILGLFASPEAVGFYAGAEKLARALMGLLVPIHQSLYPRLSNLVQHNLPAAKRLGRSSMFLMSSTGAALSLAAFLGAPWAVPLVLGKGFAASIPVLQVMAALPLLDALGTTFGVLWMVPLGLDRQFNRAVMAGGVLNLILAVVFAPRFAQLGMAAVVVATEVFVVLALYIVLRRRGLGLLVPVQIERE